MAKKAKTKVDPILVDEDLLGETVVEVTAEIVAVLHPVDKSEKILLGNHPITGEEIWA